MVCLSHDSLVCRYEGDAIDLCLDFSIEDDTFGAKKVHNLLPGGAQLAVTNANKLHYIHLAADWHLNVRLGASSAAFAHGLAQVSPTTEPLCNCVRSPDIREVCLRCWLVAARPCGQHTLACVHPTTSVAIAGTFRCRSSTDPTSSVLHDHK